MADRNFSSPTGMQACSPPDSSVGLPTRIMSAVWFGGGYSQDLPFGFSAGFQPSYFITRYDEMLPAFGKTRSDNAVMLAFTLLNRRFDYHGFTPRFSYVFTEQHSNIAIYKFTR